MQSHDQISSEAMKSAVTPSDAEAMPAVDAAIRFEAAISSEVAAALLRRRPAIAATLEYLEDK